MEHEARGGVFEGDVTLRVTESDSVRVFQVGKDLGFSSGNTVESK